MGGQTHFRHLLHQELMLTDHDLRTSLENYLLAFAIPSRTEQEHLLQASVAAEVVFTNPGVAGSGIDNLLTHIARFQRQFPGGRFRLNWLRHQHGQALAEWTQLDQQGAELLTAHSYVRLNETGQITHWAGFWAVEAV